VLPRFLANKEVAQDHGLTVERFRDEHSLKLARLPTAFPSLACYDFDEKKSDRVATMELAGTTITDQLLGHSRRNVLSLGIGSSASNPNKIVVTSACISP
jgi:hypothetical protein